MEKETHLLIQTAKDLLQMKKYITHYFAKVFTMGCNRTLPEPVVLLPLLTLTTFLLLQLNSWDNSSLILLYSYPTTSLWLVNHCSHIFCSTKFCVIYAFSKFFHYLSNFTVSTIYHISHCFSILLHFLTTKRHWFIHI